MKTVANPASNITISPEKFEEMENMIACLNSQMAIMKGDYIESDDVDELKGYLAS